MCSEIFYFDKSQKKKKSPMPMKTWISFHFTLRIEYRESITQWMLIELAHNEIIENCGYITGLLQ